MKPDDMNFAGGHATMVDGTHVPLTAADARAIWESCEAADAKRRSLMPDSMTAIQHMHDAMTRLRDEGWRHGIYCPKDGTEFAVICFGSTGIFSARYLGKWPDGRLDLGGTSYHPNGALWKPIGQLTADETAKLSECDAMERALMDAHIASFIQMDEGFN